MLSARGEMWLLPRWPGTPRGKQEARIGVVLLLGSCCGVRGWLLRAEMGSGPQCQLWQARGGQAESGWAPLRGVAGSQGPFFCMTSLNQAGMRAGK